MTLKSLRLALGLPFLLTACVDAQNLGDPQSTDGGTGDVDPTTTDPTRTTTTGVDTVATDSSATESGVAETDSEGPNTDTDGGVDTDTTTGGGPLWFTTAPAGKACALGPISCCNS